MHRVLLLTENYPPDRGGMSESCDRIVRGLVRLGVAIDLVHFDRRAARPAYRVTSFGSELKVPLENDAAHTINCLWNRVQQLIDLKGTSHVLAFGGILPLMAAPAFAAWMDRPLVSLLRGNEFDAGLFDPRRRPMLDEALRRSAVVCTVTSSHAERVSGLHPEVDARVVANGIDFGLWSATEADIQRGSDFRAGNVPIGRRLFGLFGHLKAKKGVPFFIRALEQGGGADRAHLLLIGETEETPISVSHTHLPAMDRFGLMPYYCVSDLIVLPSHYDGFPNVLIEAMALGRPILASSVGGMKDLLEDGVTAFLFPPGDERGCVDAIARAMDASEAKLLAMGERCRQVARNHCDAHEEARRYLEILNLTSGEKSCPESSSLSAAS